MNPRAIAASRLVQVIQNGRSLSDVLSSLPNNTPQPALVKALCYEALRWYFQLQPLLKQLMPKPLTSKDTDIYLLLMVGLCQILFLRIPDHAAVTETVNAAKTLKKPWATRLINGVLRNFLRQHQTLITSLDQSRSFHYAHPDWLIDQIQQAWPNAWQTILAANNSHPPLSLRVNLRHISREQFLQKLSAAGIEALAADFSPAGVTLKTPRDITTLPGFAAGLFSVQDISPQLTPPLLALDKGLRLLDACAAPGGKTLHLLETEPELAELVAIDISASRLEKAKENWQRLALPDKIRWIVADVENLSQWWDGKLFDRILLDAPCSATGVIRRHPDIKVLRKPTDLPVLARQQFRLLETLWPLLKPGGQLVYATCTVLPEENSHVVERFLTLHDDAIEQLIAADWGMGCAVGRQILPGVHDMDGFYYVILVKIGGR